jgi:hypothetical protein
LAEVITAKVKTANARDLKKVFVFIIIGLGVM